MARYVVAVFCGLALAGLLIAAAFTSQNLIPGGGIADASGMPQSMSRTFFTTGTSGGTTAVPAQGATVRILVTGWACSPGAGTTISFYSADTMAQMTASFPVLASAPMIVPFVPTGWAMTNANASLTFAQSVAGSTGCHILWIPTT